MSSSPSPEPPTSSSHKPPSQKPATDIAAAAATAAVPPPATASSSRSEALLRLKQKRLESLSHAHDDSSQVKDVDQEVHGSSNYSLRSSARSIPPPATKVHTSEPPPHINEGHRWMDEEGEEAPKQFLKRRSKAVTSIKVDWSHVRPRTITTRSVMSFVAILPSDHSSLQYSLEQPTRR